MTFDPFTVVAPTTPWLPSDDSLLVANGDPWLVGSTTVVTAGTLYLARMIPRNTITLSNIFWGESAAGVGASAGSFTGVYGVSGTTATLLSGSADIGSLFTGANGAIPCPLVTPQVLPAGVPVVCAVVFNLATTQPTLVRTGAGSIVPNANLATAAWRFAIGGTLLSALPGTLNLTANAATAGTNLWVAGN
jgi:hypothetical protein